MKFLFLLTVLSQLGLAIAGEIPGYIGQQSFRLQDDSGLNEYERRHNELKVEIARIDESRAQFENQIRILERQRNERMDRMAILQREIDATKVLIADLKQQLTVIKNEEEIKVIQAKIVAAEQLVDEKSKLAGATKLELGPINVRLEQLRVDYSIVLKRSQDATIRLQNNSRDRENYKQSLIASIQAINREGANRGQNDGNNDGSSLSRKLGFDLGIRDGEADGLNQGTIDGQARYYKRGADLGEIDGSARARVDGTRDGSISGTNDGNSNAGSREGITDGTKRGEASNAAAIGIQQGSKAGIDRAVRTGSIDGNNIGEQETVQKFEKTELNSLNINGPFAGSFQRRSPSYPGDFNGPSFNPNVNHNKEMLRKAYADGYLQLYRDYTRFEFLRRIDGDYNAAYDNRYASVYNYTVNREYPESYDQGRRAADARSYSRDYPIVKAQAYRGAYDQATSSPNRSSEEYRSNYKSSEAQAYNERFEEIRSSNFNRVEMEKFKANIGAQTEIYRQKRITEVTTVYSNNAVLEYVSSEMLDGGINGIAKLDGVFQPSEVTLHNVTLKNYGLKSALNVTVQLDNGASVKLAEIPAKSIVVIKGAATSQIASALGTTATTSLRIISQLTSNDAVEAQHFDSIGSGILKNADKKSVSVNYPMALSGLKLGSQLLKGVANKLSIGVTNASKRAYAGEIKVQVLVNSQSQIITKEFNVINGIQSSVQLTDAEVLVNSDSDIYRDLSFSATISQNGVTLGVLSSDLQAMAKAQYVEVANRPIIIANSDKNSVQLLDAVATAGGTEKVSVLDLSLSVLNAAPITNGLSGKVLLVVDDELGTSFKTLNSFIAKSKSSTFVFIDEAAAGLKNALNLASLKDSTRLLFGSRSVRFTNQHRATGVLKSSAMFQSSLKTFDQDLELAAALALTAPELIAKFQSNINRTSFFTPNILIKVYSLKAMSEIVSINKAFDLSGGLLSRNKKWIEMISTDASLFINVLKAASRGDVTEAKLSVVLPAIALRDTVINAMDRADGVSDQMRSRITNAASDVLVGMEANFKNSLKKLDINLYNKAYEQVSIHRPFSI
jgi:hypothetical protein